MTATKTSADDADRQECDTAARLGLSTKQGEAVTRDAPRAIGGGIGIA